MCLIKLHRQFSKTPIVKFGYKYTQESMRLSTVMEVAVHDRDMMVEPIGVLLTRYVVM